ncbi:DUF6445 family protein [Sphingomonas edaphi]|uniref:2OG-Fe(II) oxygenase n=1 Tax=Sphingomonas edaphi TaxID=2315689 RepID=A0A418PYF4_9SPHN|nr:DUF6445 family protein [Sphingomonas edaphi]RIX27028.1 hypothetical protein D3M59_10760 [Sphingomonas edaphi]
MTVSFALNNAAQYQHYALGPEAEPLLLIDNALADPASIVDYAASDGVYGPAGAAYPGIRRPAPQQYLDTVYEALSPLLKSTFAIPAEQRFRLDSSFSMVNQPPANLRHYQRVPHVDKHGPYDLAMVHYLCGPEFGGTHFFRHRSTGYQRISAERELGYNESLNQELNQQILPAGFPDEEHPLFERVATVEAVFNRLIIYRASTLHSPAIPLNAHYSSNPREGRLTMTSFLFALDD